MNLTGKCLIARPNVVDPYFKRSVVYIYEQTPRGIAGLILNKRNRKVSFNHIIAQRGFECPIEVPVYAGGPVNESALVLLHSGNWRSSNTMMVSDQVSVTSDDMMIYKFVHGDVPDAYKFCNGASVWSPSQMVNELHNNLWLVSELSVHQIFDYSGREQWDMAIETNAKDTIDRYI